METRWYNVAILEKILAIALLSLCALVLVQLSKGATHLPLGYDEAYNLQVADSLASGHGYASFGALRGDGLWRFDPNVTTGPAVLLPVTAVWEMSGGSVTAVRLLLLSFLLAYVVALVILLRKARNGLLIVALAVSASLSILDPPAGKVLGELPAASTLMLAAVAITRKRILLAALFVGLSVQMKLVYGLAGIVLLSAFLLFWILSQFELRVRTVVLTGLIAAAPTLLFELYRYAAIGGLDAYLASIDEFKAFLFAQNVNHSRTWLEPSIIGAKLSGLYQAVPLSAWIAAECAFVLTIVLSSTGVHGIQASTRQDASTVALPTRDTQLLVNITLAFLMIAGLAMLGGWITQSSQAGSRQALPFLFLFMPALFATMGICVASLRREGEPRTGVMSGLLLIGVSSLLMHALTSVASHRMHRMHRMHDVQDHLAEQIHVANLIKGEGPKSLYVDGWWQNPEYQLMTGVPGRPLRTGEAQMLIVQSYQLHILGQSWETYREKCAKVVYASARNLLCWLPDFKSTDLSLEVLDWGPRTTREKLVPNEQPDGGAGIWINTHKFDPEVAGPLKVFYADVPSSQAYVSPNGEHITVSIPPRAFQKRGKYEITLKQLATGRNFPVGHFTVD